jgi:predicted RNA-binding protein YlqC (UPF0109 family)
VEQVALCLARVLVDEPGRVRAEEFEDGDTLVVELTVAPSDRGRVIGRHGRTADALRTIIEAIGRRRGGQSYDLEIRG